MCASRHLGLAGPGVGIGEHMEVVGLRVGVRVRVTACGVCVCVHVRDCMWCMCLCLVWWEARELLSAVDLCECVCTRFRVCVTYACVDLHECVIRHIVVSLW